MTPELLWQPGLLAHRNHAVSLDEAIVAVADPAEVAARFARLTGGGASAVEGGVLVALPQGRLRIVTADAAVKAIPGLAVPCLPFIAGLVIGTDDGAAAISTIAAARGMRTERGFLVPAEAACGAALLFV
jgi:hypothetical protein